jgi:hypothetical protein
MTAHAWLTELLRRHTDDPLGQPAAVAGSGAGASAPPDRPAHRRRTLRRCLPRRSETPSNA